MEWTLREDLECAWAAYTMVCPPLNTALMYVQTVEQKTLVSMATSKCTVMLKKKKINANSIYCHASLSPVAVRFA